jgi:uncharacterized membrane protein YqjE
VPPPPATPGSSDPTVLSGNVTSSSSKYSEDEVATISAFRAAALEMVRWHRERADGFERRAANLLGLSGLALALVPFAVNNLSGLDRWARTSVRYATAGAAIALFVAVIGCIQTLRPRKKLLAPETDQLQDEWVRFKKDRDWTSGDVEGMFADSLLSAEEGKEPVLAVVKRLAEAKATGVHVAVFSVAVAVIALTVAVLSALVGAA